MPRRVGDGTAASDETKKKAPKKRVRHLVREGFDVLRNGDITVPHHEALDTYVIHVGLPVGE